MLVFEKANSFFKLTFTANHLLKIPKYDIFQKTLFCALASAMNSRPNAIPVVAGQCF